MGIQSQRGSSLIEVMVALFVLAIGLLGMLAMQSKAMQYNQSAYAYSQAAYLATDMAERIQSNAANAADYIEAAAIDPQGGDLSNFDPYAAGTDCRDAACNAATLTARDQLVWATNIKRYLPGGKGEIEGVTYAGNSFIRITVSFADDKYKEAQAGTYSLLVEI